MKGTIYTCGNCGMQSPKWLGHCPDCGKWDTFTEEKLAVRNIPDARPAEILTLEHALSQPGERMATGISGMDRVLGGGWVPGSVVLLGGAPGVGKSTLMLQLAKQVSKKDSVFYISGEESASQIAMRARRLGIQEGVSIISESSLESILSALTEHQPSFVVVDSIQTLWTSDLSSAPGSVSQVRTVTSALARITKACGSILVVVGHVTKEGTIAGPRTLEHMVDVVLYFEGDLEYQYRLLRSHKNRFGSTMELVVFEMTEGGLVEQMNPSHLFLSTRDTPSPGTCVTCILTGSQPLLLEIQALTVPTPFPNPRRTAVGIDVNRVHLLTAVLIRQGLNLSGYDIYVNVAGGFPIRETGADLAVMGAISSSMLSRPVPDRAACIGEVGLTGEIRPVPGMEIRLKEIGHQGFESVYLPDSKYPNIRGVTLNRINHLNDFLSILR